MELFVDFNGRIGRKQWWIGTLILFVVAVVVSLVLATILGQGLFGRMIGFVISLVFLYPAAALATKRLADQGKPNMPRLAVWYAPLVLSSFMQTFQIGFRPMPTGSNMPDMMVPGTLIMVLGLLSMAIVIWMVVELGILKGRAALA